MGSIAGVLVVVIPLWQAVDPWPWAGWVTPNQHDADIATVTKQTTGSQQEILDAIKELGRKQDRNRDEWICDEYEEELLELLRDQARGQDSVELRRKIEKLRDRIEATECERFDD